MKKVLLFLLCAFYMLYAQAQTCPNITVSIASSTNITCYKGADGSITASASGGAMPYMFRSGNMTYQSSPTFSNLKPGTYHIYAKDASGCTSSYATAVLTQPVAVSASVTASPASCYGGSDGKLTVNSITGVAPFQYEINKVAPYASITAPADITGLKSGKYRLNLVDAHGCTATTTMVTITNPPAITATTTSAPPTCAGGGDASLTIDNPINGIAPYGYRVGNTGGFTPLTPPATAQNLRGGMGYKLYLQDATGCTSVQTVNIVNAEAVQAGYSVDPITCTNSTGSITLSSSNSPNATYRLGSKGQFSSQATYAGLAAGSYYGYVRAVNGCVGRTALIVLSPASGCGTTRGITGQAAEQGNRALRVSLSPNPAIKEFNLYVQSSSQAVIRISVYNNLGRKMTVINGVTQRTLRLGEGYPRGNYIIEVMQGAERVLVKGVKN